MKFNSKGQAGIGGMVMMLVAVIIVLAIAYPVASDLQSDFTEEDTIVNSTQDVTVGFTTALGNSPVVTGSEYVTNETYSYIKGTDYNITYSSGTIGWMGGAEHSGKANVTYNWYGDAWVNQSTTRTVIEQIPILILVALIIVITGAMLVRR